MKRAKLSQLWKSLIQRQSISWKIILFLTITLILLLGIIVTGQSLRQQVRVQTASLENNLVRTIHDLNQLQRELYQLQLWIVASNGIFDNATLQQQLDITQSRFTIIKRRQQTQDLHPDVINILIQLDQRWISLDSDIQRWSQQPENLSLRQQILDSLKQLEIDANKAAILNNQQQWSHHQSLMQRSSSSGLLKKGPGKG